MSDSKKYLISIIVLTGKSCDYVTIKEASFGISEAAAISFFWDNILVSKLVTMENPIVIHSSIKVVEV